MNQIHQSVVQPSYNTPLGSMYQGKSEDVLENHLLPKIQGEVDLILTSPPFPLNRKKSYGNLQGEEYVKWLCSFAPLFSDCLSETGSIVIELGNAWESGRPTMSTLPIEALLAFRRAGDFYLCQEFISYNPARLPSPVQWVNVERIRVKDAFSRLWWMSPNMKPKADNRRVLREYSKSMKNLLKSKKYNAGERPSGFRIGDTSFLTDHGGAIPPNVLRVSNTRSVDPYQIKCRSEGVKPHPARMPLEVADFFIRLLTEEGDLVLDPFAGSNITGFASEQIQRRWISIEAQQGYAVTSAWRFSSELDTSE